MTTKSPEPAKAEKKDEKPAEVVDDTALAQPAVPVAPTYTDKDGIERVSVISEDPNWKPAPTTVTYPKAKDA